MCYSAQVVQVVRKLHRELGIRLDYDEALKLFARRLDDPSLVISRGFEANFEDPANDQERRIKSAIDEHRSRMATKLEKDLFSQKTAAAGHDRCIINLKPEHIAAWLTPQGRSTSELQAILSDRAVPVFQHAALEAA